jgi:hypothetical protein
METTENKQSVSVLQRFSITARAVFRRMRAMAGAWALLGLVMGLNCEHLFEFNTIALVANTIAWIMVMSLTGVLVSLFGGRPIDSWIGAATGATIAAFAVLRSTSDFASLSLQINFGALIGALVAATCWPWVRMILLFSGHVRRMLASAS